MTCSISTAIGLLLFHISAYAADDHTFNIHSAPKLVLKQKKISGGGLDFSSVTASALTGYLDETSNNTYWSNAAVTIAISAGLQYTADSQPGAISNLAITPYFTGQETGINVSFSFQ